MVAPSMTAVILTKNEEIYLARCLARLSSCTERIVVVELDSTDGTLDIARAAGADVFQSPVLKLRQPIQLGSRQLPYQIEMDYGVSMQMNMST